jgi:hypothetical protein
MNAKTSTVRGGDVALSRSPGTLALIRLLLRIRWLSLFHRFRAHGRVGWLVPVLALLTPLSYVALFGQALVELGGQPQKDADELAVVLMALALLLATFTNRLASGLSLLATAPENELVLARPVPLSRLTVARVWSQTLADPLGALFLLPLWTAPVLIWRLSWAAFVLSALVSLVLQLAVVSAAQLADVVLARTIPPRARGTLSVTLRLLAVAALAALWVAGSQVVRDPAAFARHVPAWRPWIGQGVLAWPAAHVLALRRHEPAAAAVAVLRLAALAALLLVAVSQVARHLAKAGWEEPTPAWASTAPGGQGRVLTPWRRELRLLGRDRGRLALIALVPIAFIAVPLLTSQGWDWTSARPERVAMLVFSLVVYLAASGPLLHMQGEQRAFWILQTVPLPLGRIMAWKATTWGALFLLLAGLSGLALAVGVRGSGGLSDAWTCGRELRALVLLAGGSAGLGFLAVGMGSSRVDLAEPGRAAVGPGTFYAFLLLAGLFNVVLSGEGDIALRGGLLFAIAVVAVWHTGMAHLRWAHDATERDWERPRASAAALFTLAAYLLPVAVGRLPPRLAASFVTTADAILLAVGLYLLVRWRRWLRPQPVGIRSAFGSTSLALAVAVVAAIAARGARHSAPPGASVTAVVIQAALLEIGQRGVVQGAVSFLFEQRGTRPWVAAAAGAFAGLLGAWIVAGSAGSWSTLLLSATAAAVRAITGRVVPWLALRLAWEAASLF